MADNLHMTFISTSTTTTMTDSTTTTGPTTMEFFYAVLIQKGDSKLEYLAWSYLETQEKKSAVELEASVFERLGLHHKASRLMVHEFWRVC